MERKELRQMDEWTDRQKQPLVLFSSVRTAHSAGCQPGLCQKKNHESNKDTNQHGGTKKERDTNKQQLLRKINKQR